MEREGAGDPNKREKQGTKATYSSKRVETVYSKIWFTLILMLMFMLKYYERKILALFRSQSLEPKSA
jgi:hypothetical protein